MTRPLPWHDTPKCRKLRDGKACGGPILISCELPSTICGACGAVFHPNEAEKAQISRAEAAWEFVLDGTAHEDRGCARCSGILLIERFRLCEPCTDADNAEKQGNLFAAPT